MAPNEKPLERVAIPSCHCPVAAPDACAVERPVSLTVGYKPLEVQARMVWVGSEELVGSAGLLLDVRGQASEEALEGAGALAS